MSSMSVSLTIKTVIASVSYIHSRGVETHIYDMVMIDD